MCHESALVERPSCSSTRNHSVFDQPCPPYSSAWRPPESRASIASRLMRSCSSSGMSPPARSASSSFGISTSSTKRRARSRSSSCSGVKSAAVVRAGAAGLIVMRLRSVPRFLSRQSELELVVVVDHVEHESARGLELSRSRGPRVRASPPPADMRPRRAGFRGSRGAPHVPAPPPPRRRSGTPPARSAATAAGSSRSGSGVMESHAWRAPN